MTSNKDFYAGIDLADLGGGAHDGAIPEQLVPQKVFRVGDAPLDIYIHPGMKDSFKSGSQQQPGAVIVVDANDWHEADGIVWWQSRAGWFPQMSIDGSKVFAADLNPEVARVSPATPVEDVSEEVVTTPIETPVSAGTVAESGTTQMQAITGVRVRDAGSTSGKVLETKFLIKGQVINVNMDSKTEADGYIWVQHEAGWSAWKSVDGSKVFLDAVGTVKQLNTYVEQLPVPLDKTDWWQYFGNNVFAFRHGKQWNYDGYSQGLHGGLDFGNSVERGIPVYAALRCKYWKTEGSGGNIRVWTKVDDFTIIYQHVTNITKMSSGQELAPDFKICEIKPGSNGHLHFEVRYMNNRIINPLLMMSDAMVKSITDKFDPTDPKYFYPWHEWTTPLDQPVIGLGGPVIGPTA
ncbi:MAG: hypothetical protein D6737_16900 [Chloroflexi bacterium]|nr:MAG: hypothetical protein CUN54_04360 [Phototrophicales bacterium]RMF77738.1 MAG: hypothetical protein D6737_16900 [Chloroflexota bacterium]